MLYGWAEGPGATALSEILGWGSSTGCGCRGSKGPAPGARSPSAPVRPWALSVMRMPQSFWNSG